MSRKAQSVSEFWRDHTRWKTRWQNIGLDIETIQAAYPLCGLILAHNAIFLEDFRALSLQKGEPHRSLSKIPLALVYLGFDHRDCLLKDEEPHSG